MGCRIGAILLHTDVAYELFHATTSHVSEFPAKMLPVSYQPIENIFTPSKNSVQPQRNKTLGRKNQDKK
jgi:hypothetical protein